MRSTFLKLYEKLKIIINRLAARYKAFYYFLRFLRMLPYIIAGLLTAIGITITLAPVASVTLWCADALTLVATSNSWLTFTEFLFPFLACLFASLVFLVRNPMYALLSLVGVFFSTVLFYVGAGIEFIGLVFLIVYVGAVAVLFLFVIMLLNVKSLTSTDELVLYATQWVAILAGVTLYFQMKVRALHTVGVVLLSNYIKHLQNTGSTIDAVIFYVRYTASDINALTPLYTQHSPLFLITTIILLAALMGAIIMATITTEKPVSTADIYVVTASPWLVVGCTTFVGMLIFDLSEVTPWALAAYYSLPWVNKRKTYFALADHSLYEGSDRGGFIQARMDRLTKRHALGQPIKKKRAFRKFPKNAARKPAHLDVRFHGGFTRPPTLIATWDAVDRYYTAVDDKKWLPAGHVLRRKNSLTPWGGGLYKYIRLLWNYRFLPRFHRRATVRKLYIPIFFWRYFLFAAFCVPFPWFLDDYWVAYADLVHLFKYFWLAIIDSDWLFALTGFPSANLPKVLRAIVCFLLLFPAAMYNVVATDFWVFLYIAYKFTHLEYRAYSSPLGHSYRTHTICYHYETAMEFAKNQQEAIADAILRPVWRGHPDKGRSDSFLVFLVLTAEQACMIAQRDRDVLNAKYAKFNYSPVYESIERFALALRDTADSGWIYITLVGLFAYYWFSCLFLTYSTYRLYRVRPAWTYVARCAAGYLLGLFGVFIWFCSYYPAFTWHALWRKVLLEHLGLPWYSTPLALFVMYLFYTFVNTTRIAITEAKQVYGPGRTMHEAHVFNYILLDSREEYLDLRDARRHGYLKDPKWRVAIDKKIQRRKS